MPLVLSEVKDEVGILTLNHPQRRNALGEALISEILATLTEFSCQKVRVVVLRATPGSTVFSAGPYRNELP